MGFINYVLIIILLCFNNALTFQAGREQGLKIIRGAPESPDWQGTTGGTTEQRETLVPTGADESQFSWRDSDSSPAKKGQSWQVGQTWTITGSQIVYCGLSTLNTLVIKDNLTELLLLMYFLYICSFYC